MIRAFSLLDLMVSLAVLGMVAAAAVPIERVVLRPPDTGAAAGHALDQLVERMRREARLGIAWTTDRLTLGPATYALHDGRLERDGEPMVVVDRASWSLDGAAVELVLTPRRGPARRIRLVAEARP